MSDKCPCGLLKSQCKHPNCGDNNKSCPACNQTPCQCSLEEECPSCGS